MSSLLLFPARSPGIIQAIRTVTKKPFKAIIYGHSHTCYGAAVLTEGNTDVTVIGHPGLNDVVAVGRETSG